MLAAIDLAVTRTVTAAFADSQGIDWALRLVIGNDALRMGVPVGLLIYVWARPRAGAAARLSRPEFIARTVGAVLLSPWVTKLLQALLPPRPRPRYGGLEGIAFADQGTLIVLADVNSFPSDTAAVAFAIAAAVWAASRPLGAIAMLWALLVVALPRLAFGYHYLSDLLAGAAIGMAAVAVALTMPLPDRIAGLPGRVAARHPALVAIGLVFLAYEFLTLFRTAREWMAAARDIAQALSG